MRKAIQDGDAKQSREGPHGYDGDGAGAVTGGHRGALPPATGYRGGIVAGNILMVEWTDDWEVTEEELWEATRKIASRDVTPGPDGIPGRIWEEVMGVMAAKLRRLYTRCV